ncbi:MULTISPECIES: hypothetical protein [unclassified Nostoc]|uniref:hypothetical protein n=1 Tax=unclassified Nostoc TaxID=2593658 RepID=UPI00260A17B8|nr:hypothetical protein [Nostoc sp. S13]MDF5739008.1 hypothetical protein [Nostoc sp. S13]
MSYRLEGTGVSFSDNQIQQLLTESSGHPGHLQRAAAALYRSLTQISEGGFDA